jgi:hypothetical protein
MCAAIRIVNEALSPVYNNIDGMAIEIDAGDER